MAIKAGYNGRKWTTHGKLTWVDYSNSKQEEEKEGELMLNENIEAWRFRGRCSNCQEFLKVGYLHWKHRW